MPGTTEQATPASRNASISSPPRPNTKAIAALQPHRALAGLRGFDQQLVDGVLADAGLADAAADRHARGIAARAVENFGETSSS